MKEKIIVRPRFEEMQELVDSNRLEEGKFYHRRVYGWPMLKKVNEGDYKILIDFQKAYGKTAEFHKLKSKYSRFSKPIITHKLSSLSLVKEGTLKDNNGIELISEVDSNGRFIRKV